MKPATRTVLAATAVVLTAALLLWFVLAFRGLGDGSSGQAATSEPPAAPAPPAPTATAGPADGATESEQPTVPVPVPVPPPTSAVPSTSTPTTPGPSEEEPSSTAPADDTLAACGATVQRLDVEDRVGQLFMLSKDTGTPVDDGFRTLLADTRTGNLVLLGQSQAGVDGVARLTAALRQAAPAPEGVGVLIAADQEGGLVQRLQGPGFDRIPTALEQASLSDADLRAAAARWGAQLSAAGVDANLAPVAGVVPADHVATNEPIGKLSRQYGSTAQEVQPKVAAFVAGMHDAGIATSLKHFPGLGRVVGNTDFSAGVVDTETTRDDPDLQSFAGDAGRQTDMIMVATAAYDLIDPGVPAAFSPVVIQEMLRGDLGFDGVVIADDLGEAQQVAAVPPGERALRFLHAGGDIVINAAPQIHRQMVQAVRDEVARDPGFAAEVDAKVARILAMKDDRGIADCG